MFNTLVCLAGAMSATTALLGWMVPAAPASAPSLDTILRDARTAVGQGLADNDGRWNTVAILPEKSVGSRMSFLIASAEQADCHFHIDFEGRATPTSRWLRQGTVEGDANVVRVRVASRGQGQPMSRAQWQCLRALVDALQDATAHDDAPLLVRIDGSWAETYGMEPGSLLEIEPLSHPVS